MSLMQKSRVFFFVSTLVLLAACSETTLGGKTPVANRAQSNSVAKVIAHNPDPYVQVPSSCGNVAELNLGCGPDDGDPVLLPSEEPAPMVPAPVVHVPINSKLPVGSIPAPAPLPNAPVPPAPAPAPTVVSVVQVPPQTGGQFVPVFPPSDPAPAPAQNPLEVRTSRLWKMCLQAPAGNNYPTCVARVYCVSSESRSDGCVVSNQPTGAFDKITTRGSDCGTAGYCKNSSGAAFECRPNLTFNDAADHKCL